MRRAALVLLLALAAVAPAAHAATSTSSEFSRVYDDFKADRQISACFYTLPILRAVRHEGPQHPAQATVAFRKELRRAITQLKTGGCPAGGAAAPAAPAAPTTTTPAPATTTPPAVTAPVPAPATSTPAPVPTPAPAVTAPAAAANGGHGADAGTALLLALAVLLALALLALLTWALLRYGPWEPEWALGARHALAEAGDRTSATWADFRDWLRLGR